jgi:serine/threonine protein kinase/tetratricopeptide (TPR) repeat protein
MIGRTVSHYRIIKELGHGGMGVVYKAQDTKLDRVVALKFLPPHYCVNKAEKERFIHEAKAASALQHNNICTIHEIDETEDGQMFICMDFYEGETLKQKIDKVPLPIQEAINIAIQIAEGLSHAHQKDIVHRDIKPANIFITSEGVVKIVDFGLAKLRGQTKLTVAGTTLGTAAYMSPEQAKGDEVDYRTDVWSLGVVLYQMVTGQQPFRGEYDPAIVYSILNEEPVPLTALRSGLPMELEHIVKKLMTKNPSERYQGVKDILVDLRILIKQLDAKGISREADIKKSRVVKRILSYCSLIAIIIVLFLIIRYQLLPKKIDAIDSIAVLPMENLSGDPEQEYFVDGMTEALITNLSKIGALKVISRTSSMQYKNTGKPLPEIARELNVDAVVEGSVLRVGDRVRITTQLIEAVTDQHLWAESYERDLRDILALQSNVAMAIAQKIESKLTPLEQGEPVSTPTVDPEAYELYLRGCFFMNKYTKEGFTKALSYFQQAIEKESNFALAYAGLAETYIGLEDIGIQRPKEAYPKAREAVNKAIKIDDKLAEAHTYLARIKFWFDWDWSGAESEVIRAIELNASYSEAYEIYSQLFRVRRELDEEHKKIRRAWELDPLGLYVNFYLGISLYDAGAYDQAIEQFKKTLELDPDYALAHWGLGLVYETQELTTKAIAAFQESVNLSPDDVHNQAGLAHAFASAGRKAEALAILEKLKERSKRAYVPAFAIAVIYEGLGNTDAAFDWLEKAYEERSSWIPFINAGRRLDSLTGDARFTALLNKIGLEK